MTGVGSKHTESTQGRDDSATTITTSIAVRPHRKNSISQRSDKTERTEATVGKVTQMIRSEKPGENRGDSDLTRSNSRGSLRLHQPASGSDGTLPNTATEKKKKRTRTRLSPTERLYEDPEVAKSAFQAERAGNPFHRRAPTPYTSRSRRRSGSGSSAGTAGPRDLGDESDSEGTTMHVERRASGRSLRSRVSFESRGRQRRGRDRRGGREGGSGDEEGSASDDGTHRPQSRLGVWDPGFGATHGIGSVGEAIEVIGLGRKEPRHRIFRREMLKPALRSAMSSRADLGQQAGHRDKPLPGRPGSIVSSMIDVLRNRPSLPPDNVLRGQRGAMGPPSSFRHDRDLPISPTDSTGHSHRSLRHGHEAQHTSLDFPRVRSRSFRAPVNAWPNEDDPHDGHPPSTSAYSGQQRPSLRSFFSSFSRGLNLDDPPFRSLRSRSRPRSPTLLIPPAENLFAYLANVCFAEWQNWPTSGGQHESRWERGGKRGGMGWEWFRRLEIAEGGRGTRAMVAWDAGDRFWERKIVTWCQQNVPAEPVDVENRWGKQIFALPAQGHETLEFFDEKAQGAGDHGLLSWMTGSLLQTAISTLHMLRHSASPFAFHLIPSPPPPYLPPRPSHTRTNSNGTNSRKSRSKEDHALWEGFGTLVSVHKADQSDRSMVIEIRPPSVVSSAVIREFTKPRREWWMLPSEVFSSEAGQANLLQAQVYDACVQNQVYFFVVTNLRQWAFGTFDSTYTTATISPVIDRKAREPSVMQCLTTWLVRSIDERPKAADPRPLASHQPPPSPQSPIAPPYSHPSQSHRPQPHSHSRSQSYPTPQAYDHYPQHQPQAYDYNLYNPYPSPALSEFGYPGYGMQSGGMGMSMQGYTQERGGYGYGTWSPSGAAVPGYGGTPSHSQSPIPQTRNQAQMGNMWYGSTGWGR